MLHKLNSLHKLHPVRVKTDKRNEGNTEISFSISWYSDKEKKNKINNAVLGDTIFYTIACNGIPNNTSLKLNLYDTNQPLGNTNLNKYQLVKVRNGLIQNSIFFGVDYYSFIDKDTGNEIEIYWKTTYDGTEYDIFNSILNLQDDEYYRAISGEPNSKEKYRQKPRYIYTCNCGWVDTSHAFTPSTRDPKFKVGADRLWKQLKDENGQKSILEGASGFKVIYTQDVIKFGVQIPVTKEYYVKYVLNIETKERIAMTIMQEVSMEFEELQNLHPTSGSSFEPADLVSNILGLYSILRPKFNKNYILESKCKKLTTEQSLKIYKKYPGTFNLSKYKNKKFTPLFFPNEFCKKPIFPKEFDEIKPFPKHNGLSSSLNIEFRDWYAYQDGGELPIVTTGG